MPSDLPDPDASLVAVFEITDGAVVPLAKIALENAAIEYTISAANVIMPGVARGTEHTGYDKLVPGRILVRAEDAARARDLLADLAQSTPQNPQANEPTPGEWDRPGGPESDRSL
jgi:hypothetical protein